MHVQSAGACSAAYRKLWPGISLLCAPLLALAQIHVVQPGDTLWGVAKDKLEQPGRWVELQQRNSIGEPRRLQPGTVLDLGATAQSMVVAAQEGVAGLQRPGSALQPLAVGMVVLPGDMLVTQANAFTQLRLPDGSRVVLPSASTLKLEAMDAKTVRLQLLEGRVESHVEKQNGQRAFEVRTRSVGLGVRGTHFRVRDEAGVTASEVLEGEVVAAEPGSGAPARRAVLPAGRGAVLAGPAAFAVQPLLPAPNLQPRPPGSADSRLLHIEPMQGATGYRMQLARDDRFLSLVYEQRSIATQLAVPTQVDEGIYHLRLTAFDVHGLEGVPGDSLIVLTPPADPAAAMVSVQRLPDGYYELRWPAPPGSRYRFVLTRLPQEAVRLMNEPSVQGGTVVLGPLKHPGRYHWRAEEIMAQPPAPRTDTAIPAGQVFSGTIDVP